MWCVAAVAVVVISRITTTSNEIGARRVATFCQVVIAAIVSMRAVDLGGAEVWTRATFPGGICTRPTAVGAVLIDAQLVGGTDRADLTAERSSVARVARVVVLSNVAVGPVACLAAREASECRNDD